MHIYIAFLKNLRQIVLYFRPLLVESSVIVIFYMIFFMHYAVVIEYFEKKIVSN